MNMKKLLLMTAMLCSMSFSAHAVDPNDWKVIGSGGIVDGKKYSLYNIDQNRYLQERDRKGANLSWNTAPNKYMRIERKSNKNRPLKCNEKFALFIEKEWLIEKYQRFGISISTRTKNNDYYQWSFKCNGTVKLNQPVTLTMNDSIMVGCKRAWGVNICYRNDAVTIKGRNYRRADVESTWRYLKKYL